MKADPTFWIATRAAGLAAYGLLTCSVVAGPVLESRPFGTRLKVATVTDVHRFLALLGLGALALHGTALTLDTAVPLRWTALFIPGQASYRPVWTAVGVVSPEAMALSMYLGAIGLVIKATVWRALVPPARPERKRVAQPASA